MGEPRKLKVLSLFAGIGGFDLGLERTGGFETVAFCEIDPFCRRVLAKHWPGVPIYDDVRELTGGRLAADGIAVDVICGGFPCQDVSLAGRRAGLKGARSGLWGEYRRLIGGLRPEFVIVENTPGLLSLGMGTVLGDLGALRYHAVWDCLPACAVGAPHKRDRVWIVAYAPGSRRRQDGLPSEHRASAPSRREAGRRGDVGQVVSDADGSRLSVRQRQAAARSDGRSEWRPSAGDDWWASEPDVGRVVHGLSGRVDRIKALGNAVVPQVVEVIGQAILSSIEGR